MNKGRPNQGLGKVVSIKLDKDLYSKLVYRADKEGKTISEIVRECLHSAMR